MVYLKILEEYKLIIHEATETEMINSLWVSLVRFPNRCKRKSEVARSKDANQAANFRNGRCNRFTVD